MLFDIVLICLLLFVSAFFSASETSLTTISKPYLLKKEQKGSKAAKMINKVINHNTNLITSILVGNTFINILIGSFVTSFGVHFGEDISVFYLSLISTTLILIFGEILPKTYSFNNSFQVASFASPIILVFMKLIKPIVFVFLRINNIFLMLTKQKKVDEDASIDNIRGAIEMFKRNDTSSILDEKAMLHGVLDLTELRAEDVMLHRKKVFCINSNEDKDIIIDQIINSNFTRIPVYENNMENIIGIIDIRDVLKIKRLDDSNFILKSLMREPFILPNTSPLVDVLTQFKEKQERMALVVDEYGSFLGIITLKDIVEEVFGDFNNKTRNISDSNKSFKKLDDGSIIVDGDVTIRDLNKKMKWELPDEEVTTIAGLILFETGSIPKIGSLFAIYGFVFEVIEKKKHQITKIKINKLEK